MNEIFDCKLQWAKQLINTEGKANKSLMAIILILRHVKPAEIKTLLTSNLFNLEIWHLPNLNP